MKRNTNKRYNLIVETRPRRASVSKHGGAVILSGIFAEGDTENGNDRKYELADLTRAINEFMPKIAAGEALSELEHSESDRINPDRACARILNIKQSGNQFLGEAVVLAAYPDRGIVGTPCGTLLYSLLQYGTAVGWSTRGLGELGHDKIVRDYHLITVDTTLSPSSGHTRTDKDVTRFVNGILESTEYVVNNHNGSELIFEALNKNLVSLPKNSNLKHEQIKSALDRFLIDIATV